MRFFPAIWPTLYSHANKMALIEPLAGRHRSHKLRFRPVRLKMKLQKSQTNGKLTGKDAKTATLLKHAPWVAVFLTSLPVPLVLLVLFFFSTTTETAAVFLLLAGLSLTIGFALGLVIAAILLLYRKNWLSKLRDRLASDGITANEVVWFRSELTSAERKSLESIAKPLAIVE